MSFSLTLAELDLPDPLRQARRDERRRRRREQHLAAVTGARRSAPPVHVDPDVPLLADDGSPVCRLIRTAAEHRPARGGLQFDAAPRRRPRPRLVRDRSRRRTRLPACRSPDPAARPNSSRIDRRWTASASGVAVAERLSSAVEPSMSVNTKVTVPCGRRGHAVAARRSLSPPRAGARAGSRA